MNITIQQINTLKAVVEQKSIQAGANFLNRTHPSVITAIKNLEKQIDFALFDRSGYRSKLTSNGLIFYQNSLKILKELKNLDSLVQHLKQNKETEINIAIGDITPKDKALSILSSFSKENHYTTLNLLFENLSGVNERLFNKEAEIIIHHIDKFDTRYEYKEFCKVKIIPVVAPDFLDFPITNEIKLSDLSTKTQCVIKSTSTKDLKDNYHINKKSKHIYVGDQQTKKEVIKQAMAWGHMPLFLIKDELKNGQLL